MQEKDENMLSKLLEYLEEDLGNGDITTDNVIPAGEEITVGVEVKGTGLLAGLEECEEILDHHKIRHKSFFKDGDMIKKGDTILTIWGDARKIMILERLMLNLLMRMTGIATTTNDLALKCKPYGVIIAGTRKTTPGFRYFEKKAIGIGGGYPHRQGLYDEILIKDNHIAIAGIKKAIESTRERGYEKIEVEVSSLEEAIIACKAGANVIMLDNMKPQTIVHVIEELKTRGIRDKIKIELSGNINPGNIEKYARTRPDLISTGYLTTMAPWIDMSLKVRKTC